MALSFQTLPATGAKLGADPVTTYNGAADAGGASVQYAKFGWGAAGVLNDVSAATPMPVTVPDVTASATLTSLNDAMPIVVSGDGSWSIDLAGFVGHIVTFESQVNTGTTWRAINGALQGVGTLSNTAAADGTYRGTAAALSGVRARLSTVGTGSVTASGRASVGTSGVFLMAPAPTGDNVIGRVKVTDGTNVSAVEPFGAFVANTGYQTLFYDEWATNPIDTTDKWAVTGTTPGVASGLMTMVATASTYNAIQTKDAVRPNVGFSLVRNGISIETAVSTGAGRFWGLGTPATVPAAAVLAQNGIGYELDQATGALLAVTYAAGVRTTVATLTRPTDGAIHAYGLYFRVMQAYWILDGVTVASQAFPNVTVAGLPALIVRQNAAAFTGTPAFANIAHLTADTSRQGTVVSDPVVGTRQARVNADGSLRVSGVPGGAALPVSGTFFQATQPVSGSFFQATQPVSGSFFQATQPVSIASMPSTPVTGAFFQATQPVSLATNTPDVTDRAARLLGQVTNAGTFAVQPAAAPAAGQSATGAAVPSGATLQGLRAATANPANATAGNMIAGMADKAGRAVMTPVQVRELVTPGTVTVAATTETTLIAAGGAGVFNDIIGLVITTAGAAAQTIAIKDATAGTTRININYPNAALAPGAPFTLMFPAPIPQGTANANWTVTQSLATACNYTFLYAKNL